MDIESVHKLTKDLKQAAVTMSHAEARYLVDAYYQMQDNRLRSNNQIRSLTDTPEPHETLAWLAENAALLERQVKSALGVYASSHAAGAWAQSIVGIGPVLSAGLLAHIDITKAPTVGHIWRFAGLDPTLSWEKGEKRPWNAALKTLCWKIGESFVKVSGHDEDVYGHLYAERKRFELAQSEAGAHAEQAAAKLKKFKIGKDTDARKAYEAGRLPPAHLHARAKRWAVKLFLAHYQAVAYFAHYQTPAPKPYILTVAGGHAHEIQVPHWPF